MVAICRLGVCHCCAQCAADSWGLANRISPIHRITFPLCVWCPMANPHFIMVAMNVIISSETHSWIGSGIDSIACRWILPTVEARWTTNLRKGETLLKVWWNISKEVGETTGEWTSPKTSTFQIVLVLHQLPVPPVQSVDGLTFIALLVQSPGIRWWCELHTC